ncbi:MAG: CBS domain-containing protein [Candidatus Sedimenticola sp. 6PFRAG7]
MARFLAALNGGYSLSADFFMSSDPITLSADTPVSEALRLMCNHRIHNIPIMDGDGHFIGLFGLRNLLQALLPKAATLSPSLSNLDFLADNLQEVVQCLEHVIDQPVRDYVEKENVTVCRSDAPIMEVIRELYEAPSSLPVVLVEGDDMKLVGMISNWDILSKLAAELFNNDERFEGGCVFRREDTKA